MKKNNEIIKESLISSIVSLPFSVLAGILVALIMAESDIAIPISTPPVEQSTEVQSTEAQSNYIRETFTSPQGGGNFELVKTYSSLDANSGRVITYYVYDIPIDSLENVD